MPQADGSTLQRLLDLLRDNINAGTADLYTVLNGYLTFFTLLALVWLAYSLLHHGTGLSRVFPLLVRLAAVLWMLDNWPWFLGGLRDLGVYLGMRAGRGNLTIAEFLDPASFVKLGLES